MATKSKIEWLHSPGRDGHSLNLWDGCSHASEGCRNCYAEAWHGRFGKAIGTPEASIPEKGWSGVLVPKLGRIKKVLNCKTARNWFMSSTTDFYHPTAANTWRDVGLLGAYQRPDHRFFILTKRPEEAVQYHSKEGNISEAIAALENALGQSFRFKIKEQAANGFANRRLPNNCALGVTVESNQHLQRIRTICKITATVHFASFEPLLEKIELSPELAKLLDWAIIGGESGSKARKCQIDWIEDLAEQILDLNPCCKIFVKQAGSKPIDSQGKALEIKGRGASLAYIKSSLRLRQLPDWQLGE